MMTILSECMGSTNITQCAFALIQNLVTTGLGDTAMAYLIFYSIIILLTITVFTITQDLLYGSIAGVIMHLIMFVLGLAGLIPLPTNYYIVGTFAYILLVVAIYQAWRGKYSQG